MSKAGSRWDDRRIRVQAIREMVEKSEKPLGMIRPKDFGRARLRAMLNDKYGGEVSKALEDAGYKLQSWQRWPRPKGVWQDMKNVKKAIRWMVRELGKDPTDITTYDFEDMGLSGVLRVCKKSPNLALRTAGFDIPIRMRAPDGFWDKRENRAKAIREMVERLDKPLAKITQKDFVDFSLAGMLACKYSASPYAALKDAGYDILPWELNQVPQGYWKRKSNRIRAVRHLLRTTRKLPEEVKVDDFCKAGMGGLISRYYSGSVSLAMGEAGYYIPGRFKSKAHFWDKKWNRVEAIRHMVAYLDKPVEEFTGEDFKRYSLYGLLQYYGGSSRKGLKEAGYDLHPWQYHSCPRGYWTQKENRAGAVRWLVETTGKEPLELRPSDLTNHKLWGLLAAYNDKRCAKYERGEMFTYDPGYLLAYPTRVLRAVVEAGYDIGEQRQVWERVETPENRPPKQTVRRPRGYWNIKENRMGALRQIVETSGKSPSEISYSDLTSRGLGGLVLAIQRHEGTLVKALRAAGYDTRPKRKKPSFYWDDPRTGYRQSGTWSHRWERRLVG